MTALDDLPEVGSFFGIDLRTGSMIVAAMGVVHPMAYGCTFFIPMSYLFVTVWILVALYFAASIVLFSGLANDDVSLCAIWIWYAVVFVAIMLMLMILLAVVYTSRKQRSRVFVVIFGLLYYLLTIYFIVVVNSHRKKLASAHPTKYQPDAVKDVVASSIEQAAHALDKSLIRTLRVVDNMTDNGTDAIVK